MTISPRRRHFVAAGASLLAACASWPLRLLAADQAKPYVPRGTKESIVPLVKRLELKPGETGLKVQNLAPAGPIKVEGFEVAPEQSPVIDTFVGELSVFYGFDSPKGVTYANALDLKALGVGRDELRKLAIANYRRLYRKLGVERLQPNIFLVVEGGELESSVMLDAVFWERARLSVSGELVAGAPARDIVLFSGTNPRSNVTELQRVVNDISRKKPDHSLSTNLYVWRGGRWEVFAD